MADHYMREVRDTLMEDPDVIEEHNELSKYRLGYAFVSFGGTDDVAGVVNRTEGPNHKTNPRPLRPEHASELADLFWVRGGKQDSKSPISLIAPVERIDPELLSKMAAVDLNNPESLVPRFAMMREHALKEYELEFRLTWRYDRETMEPLTKEQLAKDSLTLLELRNSRPVAQIVNGSHRLEAMAILAERVTPSREYIIEGLQKGTMGPEELEVRMKEVLNVTQYLTYRVEVFSGK